MEVALVGWPKKRQLVMIGTSLNTRGGISSVLRVYAASSMLIAANVRLLTTHVEGSKVKKLNTAIRSLLTYLPLLLANRVLLLHVHSASGPSFWRKFMFLLPTLLLRRPVVLHWHGGGFVDFYGRSPKWQQRIIGWTFSRCDRVIALSAQWKETLTSMFPCASVSTIPNPVALPEMPARPRHIPLAVLFLGRVVTAKGVDDLIDAWADVVRRLRGVRLVLAGLGDVEAARERASRLGIADNVYLAGWVDDEDKAQLLREASVFVLPSHAEAMPMAVLEAMAWGLPVVATRVGGIPHAVRDGEDGLLLDVGDVAALGAALTTLLTDHERRVAMGASARRRVEENFATDLVVPRIKQVWREVLAKHGDLEPV